MNSSNVQIWRTGAFVVWAVVFGVTTAVFAQDGEIRELQSMDAFTSIEDGQPGAPGEWELRLDISWEHLDDDGDDGHRFFGFRSRDDDDVYPAELELKYTGKGGHFRENMKLTLTSGAEFGNGSVEGNGDLELGWQQRWVTEHDKTPTFATLLSVRTPTGDDSSGVDVTLFAILDKDLGPGTLFLSAWITDANGGDDVRSTQWGGQLGYRWRIGERFALIGNYVHKSSEDKGNDEIDLLELGVEYHPTDNVIFGPGVFVGLSDDEEAPDLGAGIRFTYTF